MDQNYAFQRVMRTVQQLGWNAIEVQNGPGSYVYTQGFGLLDHPDIILSHMPLERARAICQRMYWQIKRGHSYHTNTDYCTLQPDVVAQVTPVHTSWRDLLMNRNYTIYTELVGAGASFDALLLVFADRDQRWPWEAHCQHHVKQTSFRLDDAATWDQEPPTWEDHGNHTQN